jgi:hypothetical protein
VPPATPLNAPQMPPHWQGILWGTLPFGSSILAILLVLIPDDMRREQKGDSSLVTPDLVAGSMVS